MLGSEMNSTRGRLIWEGDQLSYRGWSGEEDGRVTKMSSPHQRHRLEQWSSHIAEHTERVVTRMELIFNVNLDESFLWFQKQAMLPMFEHRRLLESSWDQPDIASSGENFSHRLWSARKAASPAEKCDEGSGGWQLTASHPKQMEVASSLEPLTTWLHSRRMNVRRYNKTIQALVFHVVPQRVKFWKMVSVVKLPHQISS